MDSRFILLEESSQFSRNIAFFGVIRQLQRRCNLPKLWSSFVRKYAQRIAQNRVVIWVRFTALLAAC